MPSVNSASLRDEFDVTSRTVIWLFVEQFWFEFVPVLHCLQGRLAAQGWLRELLVVEPDIAVQRGLRFFN